MDQDPSVWWGFTLTALFQQSIIRLPWAGMACHAPTRWDYDRLGIFSAKFRYGTAQVVDCHISLPHQSNDFDLVDGLKPIRTVGVMMLGAKRAVFTPTAVGFANRKRQMVIP